MSAPEFDPADYIRPATPPPAPTFQPVAAPVFDQPNTTYYDAQQQPFAPAYDQAQGPGAASFLKAILFGAAAALVGSIGWGIFAQTGIMVSIVAIGIAYLVARAMMTATGGVGGRSYQIAAVILTYFGCTVGDVWGFIIADARHGVDVLHNMAANLVLVVIYGVAGPFLDLKSSPINGALGLLILFFGLRTAWRMAAGSPGFTGGQRGTSVGRLGFAERNRRSEHSAD